MEDIETYLYIVDTKRHCILEYKTINKNIIQHWDKIAKFNCCDIKDCLYFITNKPIDVIKNINDFNYEQLIGLNGKN